MKTKRLLPTPARPATAADVLLGLATLLVCVAIGLVAGVGAYRMAEPIADPQRTFAGTLFPCLAAWVVGPCAAVGAWALAVLFGEPRA